MPATARQAVVAGHGDPTFSWPVFRRLLAAISATGHIVECAKASATIRTGR
ncbi:MAG TPA: hypothetical protein VES42_26300 [Pilimelia sp.]|nr:hypothetical protein [Pilimelia sp.]